jgi:hypothetical protein
MSTVIGTAPLTSDASPQRHPANHGATIKTTTRPVIR